MPPISFNSTPNNIRVPFFAAEFDSSRAIRGAQSQPYKALALGQKLEGGQAKIGKPIRVSNKFEAETLFGVSSMLAEIIDYYRRVDNLTELWAIALPDAPAGAKAKATITVEGSAAVSGTLYIYVAGNRLTAAVNAGDDASALHDLIAETVNNSPDTPVSATVDSGAVVLEAKHPGEAFNGLDVRFNYYTGEAFPTGVSITATPFTGGAVNPDVSDAIAAVAGEQFTAFINPYTDDHSLRVIIEDLRRRWGPMVMQEGWLFSAIRGTHGELGEFGGKRNSLHECIIHAHGIPESPWCVAASVAANALYYGNIDPARPFQTLVLTGIHAPAVEDRFSEFPENNQLLYDGISTFTADTDDTVRIGRLITTYKRNERGADDTAYLDLNTGLTLAYLRWDWRNHMMQKFPRHKLGDDGIRLRNRQSIVTPLMAKAECIVKARDWEDRGLIENVDLFKEELVVERNASDPNRLDFLLNPDLINQFIVGAAQIQFYL